jgi:site-specific DNA-methyltransferase (adenine-specific)
LYYGDNLQILREHIKDESVDLVYLDPPFNSQGSYNVLFKSPTGKGSEAQIEAFEDTWHWNDSAEEAFDDVMKSGNGNIAEMLRALRSFLKENDLMAYLTMMAARLLELHRVLKPTGSLYLHCDPTSGAYLKLLLDTVFGSVQFRTKITWKRSSAHSDRLAARPVYVISALIDPVQKFDEPLTIDPKQNFVVLRVVRREWTITAVKRYPDFTVNQFRIVTH